MNEIKILSVDLLVPADWNYKNDDPERAEKLQASITFDNSAGVLAVRELEDEKYEVIDGNHRLLAVKALGWQEVPVENFGKISKAIAVTIARRRNELWFEDDVLKLSDLFKNIVLPEISIEELERIMPESIEDLAHLIKLTDFDFDQYNKEEPLGEEGWKKLTIALSESQFTVVRSALDKIIEQEGLKNNPDGMAVEYICADFLAK